MSAYKTLGMSFLEYAQVAARMTRSVVKDSKIAAEGQKRSTFSVRVQKYENGAPAGPAKYHDQNGIHEFPPA
jgi:hypothetical protein